MLQIIHCGVLHRTIDKATLHNGGMARIGNLTIALHSGGGDISGLQRDDLWDIGADDIYSAHIVRFEAITHGFEADIATFVEGVGLDMQKKALAALFQTDIDVE